MLIFEIFGVFYRRICSLEISNLEREKDMKEKERFRERWREGGRGRHMLREIEMNRDLERETERERWAEIFDRGE